MKLSVVFVCKGRLNLTELCLRRFVELIDVPYELIMAYNGTDKEYIERLTSIADFVAIVTNPPPAKYYVSQLNDAYEMCTGDLYMHLENDCYMDNPLAVRNAIYALEKLPELDFVRMELEPFRRHQFRRIIDLGTDKIGIFKTQENGGPPYQFGLQPHIRRERLPVGRRFPDEPTGNYHFERLIDDWWCVAGRTSGCLMGVNFRHIGMFCDGGHFKPWLVAQMTCNPEDNRIRDTLTPRDFIPLFDAFCNNPYYRELYARYIDANSVR